MKSKIKRLLALVLCLTMVLNGNVSLLASDEVTAEDQVVAEAVEEMMEEVAEDATEEVTEEAIEVVAEEETEVVDEATEVLNEEEATEEVVEEEIADDSTGDTLKLQTELNGTIITMTGPKSSFPEGTDYSVSASEISEEAISDVEASLRKVELETNEKIVSYKAFDIKLIVDGKEAQPVGDVNVTFQGKEVKEQVAAAENVEVYHVDEEKQVAVEVEGDVKNNEVVMTTDHFSTYVITTQNTSGVTVTVQHYLTSTSSTKTQLYRDSQEQLTVSERLEDISVAANYKVDKVVKMPEETEVTGEDVIIADTTYRVYYSPTTGESTGAVQMFDYHVNKKDGTNSINTESNYGDGAKSDYKITSGKVDQNHDNNKYNVYVNGKNINAYTGGTSVVTGIITGVDYATGALKMANGKLSTTSDTSHVIYEPGFFTREAKIGKQILDNFTLKFDRTGDTYTLNSVWNGDTKASDAGSNFYPVDNIGAADDSANDYGHNHFFGLRYDIEFKIGDYVGPLTYSFSGDDDLWVVLDAKDDEAGGEVVVDLGGIHQAATGTVDIWSALNLNKNSMTEEQKNKTHTLTVLYMERGAGSSNCNMTFTLPNSKVINSSVNPTSFAFTKVTSKDQPLAGAEFGLYNGTTLIDTVTSDASGVVKFESLYPGTYTVKETKAPSGYVKDTTEYTLTVTKNNDNYVTSMTVAGSSAEVTKVTNYTQQEEAVKNITQNKTATVLNENDRTFTINLTAATRGETAGTDATAASIVLVLDASSSMDTDNAFSSLQEAVAGRETGLGQTAKDGFIDKIAAVSPNSKIGIVWYNGDERISNKQVSTQDLLSLNDDNVEILEEFVRDHDTDGATPMGDGLEAAYNMIKDEQNEKYVIFFTDGMPGYFTSWGNPVEEINCMVANNAVNQANLIKSNGATLYTVGYNLAGKSFAWREGDSATSYDNDDHSNHESMYATTFLSSMIATSSEHAFTADSIDDLQEKFDDLAGELGSLFEAQADRIVDVIDPRFDLVTTEAELKAAYGAGVSVSKTEDGRTQIIWTGDSAKIRNEKDEKGPWSASFVVQAKPEFVGGNMIPTNGPESGIYIDSNVIKFPQPSVNVKLLQPELTGKEITVYKGDKINTTEFASYLAETLKVIQLYDDKDERVEAVVAPVLTDDQVTSLNSGTAVFINYSYGTTSDVVGQFKFEYVPAETPEVEHLEDKEGTPAEVYTLKVTYIPKTVEERETQLAGTGIVEPSITTAEGTSIPEGGTVVVATEQKSADYKVNVIAGQIVITKELVSPAARTVTFEFTVNMPSGQIVIPLTINQGQTEATYDGSLLQNLPRGTYTISEVLVETHDLERTEIGEGTDSQSSVIDKVATIELGYDLTGNNVISANYGYTSGGVRGEVIFTNKEATADLDLVKITEGGTKVDGAQFDLYKLDGQQWMKQGDTSTIVNNTDSTIEFDDLVPGRYKLVEVIAPEGCAILATPIYFNVSEGLITLVNEDGSAYVAADDSMWVLEGNVLTIKNAVIYELPQSGGIGIYMYMIGGIMLMVFATFVLYKNRRKEVLAR